MATKENESEWNRRQDKYRCERKYMSSARFLTVSLACYGYLVASRTDLLKRGKVISSIYTFPSLASLDELLALPVAK